MAKIIVVRDADGEIGDALVEVFTELANKVGAHLPVDTELRVFIARVDQGDADTERYMISVMDEDHDIEIWREYDVNKNTIEHQLFQMAPKYQKRGIAKQVMAASLAAADKIGAEAITVEAGLDVGGYAWLRKGAFPDGGKDALLRLVSRRGKNHENLALLASDFILKTGSFSDKKMREFVLSDEFREYAPIFLGAGWNGSFDIKNQRVRAAMLGEVYAAPKPKPKTPKIPAKTLTANETILDAYVRHQTYVMRYAGGLRNRLMDIVQLTDTKTQDVIIKYATLVDREALLGKRGQVLLSEFGKALRQVRGEGWDEATKVAVGELKEFAIAEAAGTAALIEGAVPVVLGMTLPPAQHLLAIVNARPFEGRTLKEWMQRTKEADVERMLALAKAGIVDGVHPREIARSIIPNSKKHARLSPALVKARRDVEAVTLTLTNGIQQEAKQALYEANSDIVDAELYVATLDASTTPQCAGHDGKSFPRGKGPIPPLHFRCRSLRVPYFGEPLGQRPFKSHIEKELLSEYTAERGLPKAKARANLPMGHKTKYDAWAQKRKRQMIGRVPAHMTYSQWLKTQTPEFQKEVLGATRAKMFRDGSLTLDKFVAKDGSLLTLDELKRKGYNVP